MTRDAFQHIRKLEGKLNVRSLTSGIKGEEIRIWELSGSYDPLVLRGVSAAHLEVMMKQVMLIKQAHRQPIERDTLYNEKRILVEIY